MKREKKYQWVSQKEGEPIMENSIVFNSREECRKDMINNIFLNAKNIADVDISYIYLEFRGEIAWLNGVKFSIEEI